MTEGCEINTLAADCKVLEASMVLRSAVVQHKDRGFIPFPAREDLLLMRPVPALIATHSGFSSSTI